MTSANLELVQSIYAAWERGDFRTAEWADPEIKYVTADGPEPGSLTGLAEIAEGFRNFLGVWEDFCLEAEEYRELDGERVLSCSITSAGAARRAAWSSGKPGRRVRGFSTFAMAR